MFCIPQPILILPHMATLKNNSIHCLHTLVYLSMAGFARSAYHSGQTLQSIPVAAASSADVFQSPSGVLHAFASAMVFRTGTASRDSDSWFVQSLVRAPSLCATF